MKNLTTLWRGELPLSEALWTWAVTIGLIVNIATSLLFLTLITQDQPLLALLFGYGVSLPYNFVASVSVWRAASRYDGPAIHADLARTATVVIMAALSLT
jgi:hypothetical protein